MNCHECGGQGWIAWGLNVSKTPHPSAIRLLIRCSCCNVNGKIPVPSLDECLGILGKRDE